MLTYVWYYLNSRIGNQKGQGMVEYGLILALVSVVAIMALTPIGTAVSSTFETVSGKLNGTN